MPHLRRRTAITACKILHHVDNVHESMPQADGPQHKNIPQLGEPSIWYEREEG